MIESDEHLSVLGGRAGLAKEYVQSLRKLDIDDRSHEIRRRGR
jgi:hypothetical protein